jgi:signal transduction histidine kinase
MESLVLICIMILIISLLFLFIFSCFISRRVMRPVEDAWNLQQQFIADVSHELKTPLTVILANQRILLAHTEDTIEDQKQWVENTLVETNAMKRLVEQLLFLARSDAKMPISEKQRINLSDTTWSVLLHLESLAYEHGITLTESITPDLQVMGDQKNFSRLLSILLENACKYAGDDKRVALTLTKQKNSACLTVKNTGDPIPPEDMEHLFDRFYRPDKSRSSEGFGLGLPIAQAIVKDCGGKITATSNNRETCFTITLPLVSATSKRST